MTTYKGGTMRRGLVSCVALLLCSAWSSSASAGIDSGLQWLADQQRSDGSFASADDIAATYQATAESIRALSSFGHSTGTASALEFVNAEEYSGVEFLARRIIANSEAGAQTLALAVELLTARNRDGSLGEFAGYDGNVLDTAYALEALAVAGQSKSGPVNDALLYLISCQQPDGSWSGLGSEASVYVTSRALRALWLHRRSYALGSYVGAATDYLLAARGADQLWGETHDSAAALIAVLPILTDRTPVAGSVDSLLSRQLTNGSWENGAFTTALALRALAAASSPSPDENLIAGRVLEGDTGLPLSGVSASLDGPSPQNSVTDSSGRYSFNNLPPGDYSLTLSRPGYATIQATTALSTGSQINFGDLHLLKQQEGATTGTVRGMATDADSGLPIAGVAVALSTGETAATGTDGSYQIANVVAGQITLIAEAAGYNTASASGSLAAGGILVFSPRLKANAGGTGRVTGTVTDSGTGQPIAGASVATSSGISATSDANGGYELAVPAGSTTLTASATGYGSVIAAAQISAGGTTAFSPQLKASTATGGVLQGTVTDATTGQPIEGASVVLLGANSASITTTVNGTYSIENLAPGDTTVRVGREDYAAVVAVGDFGGGAMVDFSPALQPLPAGVSAVRGVVVDSIIDEPLADVAVSAVWEGGHADIKSGPDGSFSVSDIAAETVDLSFSREGYLTSAFFAPLDPGAELDLGEVRLRPEGTKTLLPDLTLEGGVDMEAVVGDPQTLNFSGDVRVGVKNRGTAIAAGATLVAFRDLNGDGHYHGDTDVLAGEATVEGDLVPGESADVSIPVSGSFAFRDEPLAVEIDSIAAIVESDEGNNSTASSQLCRVEPQPLPPTTIKPIVKWRWSGQLVTSTPAVAPLRDTNGDGRYDEYDDPVIVFLSHDSFVDGDDAYLRAVDGKTGQELWAVTSSSLRSDAPSSPAVGDLDGDGIPEIVMYRYRGFGGGIIAINADGTHKWTSPYPPSAHSFYNYGALSIADLDGDGRAEILARRYVLNYDGSLKSSVGGPVSHAFHSIAVDMDLDGMQEVVFGGQVYRHDGTLYSNNFPTGAGVAVAINIDDDEYPEIAYSDFSSVRVVDHTGQTLWVKSTVGGRGGPLLAADVDGGGIPELGIASAGAYTVYRTDGSIVWSRPIVDGSGFTGSTAFDFNGDGRFEIVYHDERNLYVYEGSTGAILYQTPNHSTTAGEQPIVADVDGDGHAEIVLVSDSGSTFGLRVIENVDDSWVPTRKIWNQHSYHITNVDDDGGIPGSERPSWLLNNSYRVNAFIDRSALDSADLTLGYIRVEDRGQNRPIAIRARVGNAGLTTSRAGAIAHFYQGDPSAGGAALGSAEIPGLAPGQHSDVELSGITELSHVNDIWVVADAANVEPECDETNNTHSVPFHASAALGRITVATDQQTYSADADAVLSANAANTGSLANAYTVELIVEDEAGAAVVRLGPEAAGTLAAGQAVQLDRVWPVGHTLAGDYVLRGILRRDDGAFVDEDIAPFSIVAPAVSASLRVTTDRPVYHTTDRVEIASLARNLASNQAITDPQIVISVIDPSGLEILSQTLPLTELAPGAQAERAVEQRLTAAAEGSYTVNGTLLDAAGTVLAIASAQYEVEDDPSRALSGEVSVDPLEVPRGQPAQCTDTVHNRGTQARNGQIVRQSLIRLDVEADIGQTETTVDLPAGGSQTLVRSLDTGALEPGDYACVLEAKIGETYTPLDHAVFKAVQPPIEVEADLSLGSRGRVLVLLDEDSSSEGGCAAVESAELWTAFDPPLPANATVEISLIDEAGQVIDGDSRKLGSPSANAAGTGNGPGIAITDLSADILSVRVSDLDAATGTYRLTAAATSKNGTALSTRDSGPLGEPCSPPMREGSTYGDFEVTSVQLEDAAADPHGTHDAPDLAAQRSFLEQLLTEAGWSYTIVTHKDAFADELRSGEYVIYALFAEHEKLDEQVQKELREAVYRGEGLLDAGEHDQRHHRFDDALGITWKGKHSNAQGVELLGSSWHGGGYQDLTLQDKAVKAALDGAVQEGRFLGVADLDAAVASHHYGNGKSVYVGFDLLAEATGQGADGLFAKLLLDSLAHVQPAYATLTAGQVVPLRINLTNRGIAVEGRALFTPPAGVIVEDPGTGTLAEGTWEWPFDLAEDASQDFTLWVRLPEATSEIDVHIQTLENGSYVDHTSAQLSLTPQPQASLPEALTLAATDKAFKQVEHWLDKAHRHLADGLLASALSDLVEASDEVLKVEHADASALRQMIDEAIRHTGIGP